MILTATINEVKRRILFDNPQAVVAVKGDYEVNGIAFAFPAIYEDDFDLSTAVKTVYYKATDGIIYNHVVTATDTDTGYPLWVFKDEINKGAYGDVEFALVCDKVEGGNIVKRWVSMITAFRVQKSIEIDESEQEENEQTYSERLAYLMTQMANMQATVSGLASGAPTPVSLASAMTDTSRLYVYTGSESGYTTGHWYYYNGSAWADGGQYGGTTVDTTLTQSGQAADAKVTGDKIAEIKEDLSLKLGLNYNKATTIRASEESPADLNDYRDVGNYNILNTSNASHIANMPYVSGGYLVVMSQAPNAKVQVFIPNIQRTHIYVRMFSSSAWGEWIDATPLIDSTPTKNGEHLVSSGGVYNAIVNATESDYASENVWERGTFGIDTGETNRIDRIRTNWFNAGVITSATALDGYEFCVHRMSQDGVIRAWNGVSWQTMGAWVTNVNLSSVSAYKIRFLARNANAPTNSIKPSEGANIILSGKAAGINRNAIDILADKTLIPNSYGLANVLAKFNRMLNIEWTPVADIPAVGSQSVFKAGVTYKGMLYSSTRLIGKVVGLDVSFKTFLTAMKNPRSVLYTKRLTHNLGKAYYGSTCASCIDYAMGWGTNYVGAGIMAKPEVSKQNYINLQSGDILYSKSAGHLIMVHDVFKDEYGRPCYVLYDEAFMPKARQLMQKYSDFVNYRTEKGYVVLRNNDIGETEYPAEPYVKGYPDETPISVPDYDIMCNYGDEAVLLEGTDVIINVLNTDGYTSITVYKDDTLIQTITTIADFTLSNLAYGEYRVTMQGDSKESSTSFVIVQATCSWDANTHILTFSSANATPGVAWLNDNGTSAFNMYDVDVTAEDIANGYIDLSDAFTEHPDAVNVRLDFKYNGYTASWFSYFNPAWVIDV